MTQEKMTQKDVTEAACALSEWFMSQEISQHHAVVIMLRLVGTIVTTNGGRSIETITASRALISEILDLEIARTLEDRRGRNHKA